jgi:hypothetical protein
LISRIVTNFFFFFYFKIKNSLKNSLHFQLFMCFVGLKNLEIFIIVTSMSFTSFTQISLLIYFLVNPSHKIYLNVSRFFMIIK